MKKNIRVLCIDTYPTKTTFLLALIWLLFFYFIFMHISTVAAHSSLVKTEPQDGEVLNKSPAQVTTWFSEELDAEFSTLRVFNSQNNQVDNGDGGVDLNDLDHLSMVVSLPPLSSGMYKVQWAAVSTEDGDATEGEFTFSVSGGTDPSALPTPSRSGSQAWLVSGVIVLLLFVVLIWFFFLRRRTPG